MVFGFKPTWESISEAPKENSRLKEQNTQKTVMIDRINFSVLFVVYIIYPPPVNILDYIITQYFLFSYNNMKI